MISASLYSLGAPTLAHRLVEHFEMDPTTDKYHITGVGCASGVPLMRLAAQSLREHPDKHALVVAADSMSGILMGAMPEDPKAKTVGSAIFGDGCAAALLSNDPRADGPVILASQVHQIGGTLGAVSLQFSQEDSYLHLARELPDLAGAGLPGVVGGFLRRNELERADIDHWIVHPGGRRIIENVQTRARALPRGRRHELGRARRARQHRHAVDPVRAQGHDRALPARARRARPAGHDRPRRHRRADAARLVGPTPPLGW